MKGLSARSLAACKARAKSSLPVPVSPSSRIGMSCGRTRFAASILRAINGSPKSSSSRALRFAVGVEGSPRNPTCVPRSEEHTSELQSRLHLVCRLLLEKKKKQQKQLDYSE